MATNHRYTRAVAQRERKDPEKALLDAAERLLERDGFIGISTRKVAGEAGINPALVHYYFNSIEDLCARVMQRFSEDAAEDRKAPRSRVAARA